MIDIQKSKKEKCQCIYAFLKNFLAPFSGFGGFVR